MTKRSRHLFAVVYFSVLTLTTGENYAAGSITPISRVQGKGVVSPLADGKTRCTVEGVVTAVFPGLDGCFLEEQTSDIDASSDTSEGLFLYTPGTQLAVGSLVTASGQVIEHGRGRNTETRLTDVKIEAIDTSQDFTRDLPPPVTIALPQPSLYALESFEGMRVTIGEPLYVTDTYNLGRFGEVMLSSGAPLRSPTAVASPGKSANNKSLANRLNQIFLDDGQRRELSKLPNPRVPYIDRVETKTLRRGSRIINLTGILTQASGYRVHPVIPPKIEYAKRPAAPRPAGNLVVASFNVLNYFVTLDNGENGARGADSEHERQRQKAKILLAIEALDADICGLAELETGDLALRDLADSLTDFAAVSMPLNFASAAGADYPIQVGILYKPAKVTPVGPAVVLDDPVFANARPPIAQAFRHRDTGEVVTAVVCHLKSKGRAPEDKSDPDSDKQDGQGAWNASRTLAAQAIAHFVSETVSESASPHAIVMGDFNAYQKEDPIQTILSSGLELAAGADSYVYYGASGALDYIFCTKSLGLKVTQSTTWLANSAEPRAIDYNDAVREHQGDVYEPLNPETELYRSDPYRSSDHDIPVVGFSLTND